MCGTLKSKKHTGTSFNETHHEFILIFLMKTWPYYSVQLPACQHSSCPFYVPSTVITWETHHYLAEQFYTKYRIEFIKLLFPLVNSSASDSIDPLHLHDPPPQHSFSHCISQSQGRAVSEFKQGEGGGTLEGGGFVHVPIVFLIAVPHARKERLAFNAFNKTSIRKKENSL